MSTSATVTTSFETSSSSSCWTSLAHLEWLCCSMGNLWGRIESTSAWGVWWLARHAIYVGLTIILVALVPTAILYVSVIFLVAHVYKFGRFAVLAAHEEKQKLTTRQAKAIQSNGALDVEQGKATDDVDRIEEDASEP